MLDLSFFSNPRFSLGAPGAIGLTFFALFGTIFAFTQYLQFVRGLSPPSKPGVRILPVAGGLVLGGAALRPSHRDGSARSSSSPPGSPSSRPRCYLMTQFEVGSGYELVAAAFVVLGFGIGLAMTPATDAVMGSLPLAKASVGSAVNDAARVTGGALGVAVLGSIMSSGYRGEMGGAHDSLAGSLSAAAQLGGSEGARLAVAAQEAFVNGMHVAVLVGAAIALVGALVALFLLPAREQRTAVLAVPVPA